MKTCRTIRASVPDPCPRRVQDGDCVACTDDWNERAAIVEYVGGMKCDQAEDAATAQALRNLPGQRALPVGS